MSTSNPSISLWERNPLSLLRKVKDRPAVRVKVESNGHGALAPEPYFLQTMTLERKRAERSGKHFLLMVLAGEQVFNPGEKATGLVVAALATSIRETDPSGWYRQGQAVGVIFTEVDAAHADKAQQVLRAKLGAALRSKLPPADLERIQISFHLFPETFEKDDWLRPEGRPSELQAVEILEAADLSTMEQAKPLPL